MARARQQRLELLQGTLDLLILRTLQIDHGSLYPALHRLERQGWLGAEWKTTENKQRAKYYRLTASGRRQVLAERDRWTRLAEAIARVLDPA